MSLTILIAARNAAATIERAVRSCLPEADCAIVLVDDHSGDDTVARARTVAGSRLSVLEAPDPGGVAIARQCALDAVDTTFAAWLDADDEWIPGRASRLCDALAGGSDIASESIALYDGTTGIFLRTLPIPAFLRTPGGAVRLFERNFLPGDTQIAFRVQTFRDLGGYDPSINGPESFDVLLRAIQQGARLWAGDEVGYRMYAYPASLSRNLSRQRASLAAALTKHRYEDVRALYLSRGYAPRIAAWALVMMAQFRGDTPAALRWLEDASPVTADPWAVLEPAGPWPFPEGWRRAFHRGTILLHAGGRELEAVEELYRAEAIEPTPETTNNLGVGLWRLRRQRAAHDAFAAAHQRRPGYLDASLNHAAAEPSHITTHPLRREPSRTEYLAVAS